MNFDELLFSVFTEYTLMLNFSMNFCGCVYSVFTEYTLMLFNLDRVYLWYVIVFDVF